MWMASTLQDDAFQATPIFCMLQIIQHNYTSESFISTCQCVGQEVKI